MNYYQGFITDDYKVIVVAYFGEDHRGTISIGSGIVALMVTLVLFRKTTVQSR